MAKDNKKKSKKFTGDFKEKNIVSHKFIEAYNKLKQKGVFNTYDDFAVQYGYGKEVMTKIATGVQEVPMILLWAMITDYGVNPGFFFDIEKELLRK
ncbi:MAG: hypothetical protein HYX39_14530 [Bacteroidetes bacterium]|nr:hypothetical protein [Bacteroidota bacterium]